MRLKKRVEMLWMILWVGLLASWALPAYAQEAAQQSFVDWTEVVVGLIGVIGTALAIAARAAWANYVRPWLEQKGLSEAAGIVVNAVEALLGRYCGEDKWRLALAKMGERGFDVDDEAVLDALNAAWKQMDISQIAAGEKDSGLEPEEREMLRS